MLKSPEEFAALTYTLNGNDKLETIQAIVAGTRSGSLQKMPAAWIAAVIEVVMTRY